MSGRVTISGTYTSGLGLTGTQTNTFVFASSATVANTGRTALSGHGAYNWSIQNAGLIQVVSGSAGSGGIVLVNGSVDNAASGRIEGYTAGIGLLGKGTVSNQGTIASRQTAGSGYSYTTASRTATILSAAVLLGSGSVTNTGAGVISGGLGGIGTNGAGNVANAGSIDGGQFGIFLAGGGNVTNTATGTIGGGTYAIYGGILGAMTVANQGIMYSAYGVGAELFGGGIVNNASGGTISGGQYGVRTNNAPSTLNNAGMLYGMDHAGAALVGGGQFNNAATGIVDGYRAGFAAFGPATVSVANSGTIKGFGFGVVAYTANAQVSNSGTIVSQESGWLTEFGGAGVALKAGGSVTNAAGGVILARWIGVQFGSPKAVAGGTLVNDGYILCGDGNFGAAVWVHGQGLISNSTSGKIEGGPFGIVSYYRTTLINSGYIVGTDFAFDAVRPGFQQRVIVNPGATFIGTVYGGNPIGSSVVSTLELGSGASAGTLSGIGTQFIGFGQVTVDSGANWTLTGANTILSGATLADSGTLTNTGSETGGVWLDGGTIANAEGATIQDVFAAVYEPAGVSSGLVVNAGVLAGPTSGAGAGIVLFSGGTVINTGAGTISGFEGIYIDSGGTVINAGQIMGYMAVGVYLNAGGSVTNAEGATIAGALSAITVRFQNAAGQSATVVNHGLVAGGLGYGVQLVSPGHDLLINGVSGVIVGGVYAAAGATVSNAGSIGSTGTNGLALRFGAGSDNRLVLYPGAVFAGTVDGGNTLGATSLSTLELALGAPPGMLTGLGVKYIDFGQIVIDPGTNWTIAGNVTLTAGQTLITQGRLTDPGVQLQGGSLTNAATGTIAGTGLAAVRGASTGTGTVVNFGVIEPADYGVYLPAGGLVTNAAGASIEGNHAGIDIEGAAGSVINGGVVLGLSANNYAIALTAGGSVVNAANGTITGGSAGAFIGGAAGTVANGGTILASLQAAVVLNAGGLVTNQSGGVMAGYCGFALGVGAYNVAATVINAGSIASAERYGVYLNDGGSVVNLGGATIAGYSGGVVIQKAAGIVTNSGLIASRHGNAVYTFHGRITNLSGGTISGTTGIFVGGGATVVDAGTIAGITDAIMFAGTGNRLILQHGYALQGTIGGFGYGDTIEFADITVTGTDYTGGILTLVAATGTVSLDLTGNFTASQLVVKNVAGGAEVSVSPPAPTITGAVAMQTTTDLAPISPFSKIAIADPNAGQTEILTVTLSASANGALSHPGPGSFNPATGVYTVTGTAATVNAALDALVFTPTAHQVAPGQAVTTAFTILDSDTAGATASDSTTTVIALAVASPLAITGALAGQKTGDTTALLPLSKIVIADPNAGQTETATVTLSAAANGTLSNLGAGSYNAATGTYMVTGTAAAVNAALDALIFTPTAHQVAPGQTVTTTFTITDTDTVAISATDSSTTVIATVAPAPITIAGTVAGQTTNDVTALTPFSLVKITDPNFGQTETVTVTLSAAANGTLSNIGTGTYNAATGVYTVTGTATGVNAALDSLVFTPTARQVAPGQTVTTTFTIKDTDTAAISATDSTTIITATAVAIPITVTGAVAGQKTSDTSALTPFSLVKITDLNAGQTETVTVTLSAAANGILSNLGTGTYNASTGVYTVTGTAAGVNAALALLVFTPTAHQVAPSQAVTTTFTIKDTDTAAISATDSTTTITATAVAVPITVTGAVAGLKTSDTSVLTPFSLIRITDPNAGQTETATVTLSDAANGFLSNLGIGSYNAATGTYTITGTAGAVNTTLASLIFTPTAHQVVPGQTVTTTFTIKDTDTAAISATDSNTTVIATAAPTPITIAGTLAGQTTNDATVLTPFSLVNIIDSNFGQTQTVTVTLSAAANGILSNPGIGSYNAGTGVYAVTGTAAAITAALDALVFRPTSHQVSPGQTVTTGLTIKVKDTALITNVDSVTTVLATALAGRPTITGAVAGQTTTDLAIVAPFSNVTITDPNANQTETVTIALSTAANGIFGNLSGGSYNAGLGIYSVSGTALVVTAAIAGLVFIPAAHKVPSGQTVTTTFTITDIDTAGVSASDASTTVIATGSTLIEGFGSTRLVQIGTEYFMQNTGGTGPPLQYGGAPVIPGQFGAWTPVGAEANIAGYAVAWRNGTGTTAQYVVWQTNNGGSYTAGLTGVVARNDLSLEMLESSFQQDLNGDATIGAPTVAIETFGAIKLVQIGIQYVMQNSGGTGPALQYGGTAVVAGQFGTWAPVGAEANAGGYEVAWRNVTGTTAQYIVWQTNSGGSYTGGLTGIVVSNDLSLEILEPSFQQDLNGDGATGAPTVVIEALGATKLVQIGTQYFMQNSGGTGPALQYGGAPVIAGQLGTWTPVAAEANAGGYEIALRNGTGTTAQFIVWQTNSSGSFTTGLTGAVASTDLSLEMLEPSFQEDLNGDGTTGVPTVVIETRGATKLVQIGTQFLLRNAGDSGPVLQFSGAPVVSGQFGTWAPVAVEANASGYEIAWRNGIGSAAQFIVWQTNSSGNYNASLTGVVSNQDFTLQDLEPGFQQDLNGNGQISTQLITTGTMVDLTGQSQAATINLGPNTASAAAGLTAPSLTFIGIPDAITLGTGASIVEYALQAASGIETIANFVLGTGMLNIDLLGAANSALRAYATTVGGVPAIALASSGDAAHGIVLLNMAEGQTAANLLAFHTTFSGGHAMIG